ncbi:hypothetical protein JCM10908_003972 [Rhodotorula pacifica]|uniref:uncharacterized protein n=1 Tax=Rhodotorula pacifica TaxID=1495444 RepID=UPI00317711D0
MSPMPSDTRTHPHYTGYDRRSSLGAEEGPAAAGLQRTAPRQPSSRIRTQSSESYAPPTPPPPPAAIAPNSTASVMSTPPPARRTPAAADSSPSPTSASDWRTAAYFSTPSPSPPPASATSASATSRRPLHTPPVLLPSPSLNSTASNAFAASYHGGVRATPSPPRSPVVSSSPARSSSAGVEETTPTQQSARRRRREDSAKTLSSSTSASWRSSPPPPASPRSNGSRSGTYAGSSSIYAPAQNYDTSAAAASHPLAITSSQDSTFSSASDASSSAASTSSRKERQDSGSASENENAWARSWISEDEEDLADLTPMVNNHNHDHDHPHARASSSGLTSTSSPSSALSSFAHLRATNDLGAHHESEASAASSAQLPPLAAIEPLFSFKSAASKAAAPATSASEYRARDDRPGTSSMRAVTRITTEAEARPLSEFDWAAAYADGASPSPSPSTSPQVAAKAVDAASSTIAISEGEAAQEAKREGGATAPQGLHLLRGGKKEQELALRSGEASLAELSSSSTEDDADGDADGDAAPPPSSSPNKIPSSPTRPNTVSPPDERPLSTLSVTSTAADRPVSRASTRSNFSSTSAPARPPRRQPSAASLAKSNGDADANVKAKQNEEGRDSLVGGVGSNETVLETSTSVASPPVADADTLSQGEAVPREDQQEHSASLQSQAVAATKDPMALLDSLISQSGSAVVVASEPTTPTALGATTGVKTIASPPPPPPREEVLASSPASPLSPAPALANSKKERPAVPLKSSRRASLLARRRQSDSQTLQRAVAVTAAATATASLAEGAAADARRGSVPGPTSPPPSAGAASPTPSRNSSNYDLTDIADVYARNSLYYPPPDATPRSLRILDSDVPLPSPAVTLAETTSSGTITARQSRIEQPELATVSATAEEGQPRVVAQESRPEGMTPSRRSSSSVSRADAKARAAAFIEDLKRAKADAAAVTTAPLSAGGVDAASRDLAEPAPASNDYLIPLRPEALSTVPATTRSSAEATPPLPPPSSTKPSEDATIYSSGSRRPSLDYRSTTNLASLSGSRRPSEQTLASLAPRQPYFEPSRPRLLQRRALPSAVIISAELKKATTARDRCRIYEDKLNELGRERSRLDEWILATSGGRRLSYESPELLAVSPNRSRRARQDSSVATFAPRGDGYRAKEIPRGSYSSYELSSASAPFPGVLNLTPSRSASHASLASGGPGGSGGKSFFSSLGGRSLGRRMSKRDHASGPPSRSSAKSSIRSTISGPVQILSSTNSALAPVSDGPYRPLQSNNRASFDSRRSSPATSPQVSRASFSYGSTSSLPPSASFTPATSIPTFQVTRGSVYYDNGEKTAGSQLVGGDLDEEKLDRLADILPQASRADLAAALEDAGGDDVLAISVYLSSEPSLT